MRSSEPSGRSAYEGVRPMSRNFEDWLRWNEACDDDLYGIAQMWDYPLRAYLWRVCRWDEPLTGPVGEVRYDEPTPKHDATPVDFA